VQMYCLTCHLDYDLEDPAWADQIRLATYFAALDNRPLPVEACSPEVGCHSYQVVRFASSEEAEMFDPGSAFADAFPYEASSLDPDCGAAEVRTD
jgi:hypothetical protein